MTSINEMYKTLKDLEKEIDKDYFGDTFFYDIPKELESELEFELMPSPLRFETEIIMMRGFNLYPKADMHIVITDTSIKLMHNWAVVREWNPQQNDIINLYFEEQNFFRLSENEKSCIIQYFKKYHEK